MIRDGIGDDIFNSGAQALVNPVNCVGVAGAGLAKEFKEQFPWNFEAYVTACKYGNIWPGRVLWCRNPGWVDVVNFPTKRHWREKSIYSDIVSGLEDLRRCLRYMRVRRPRSSHAGSIAIPALGCGLGGLDWQEVRPAIVQILGHLEADVDIYLYPPQERKP